MCHESVCKAVAGAQNVSKGVHVWREYSGTLGRNGLKAAALRPCQAQLWGLGRMPGMLYPLKGDGSPVCPPYQGVTER